MSTAVIILIAVVVVAIAIALYMANRRKSEQKREDRRVIAAEHLHVNVHRPAADQPVVPAVIMVEAEREQRGSVHREQFDRAPAHFCFDAPPAERADRPPVADEQHPRPALLRRAPARRDDRAQRDALPTRAP